MTLIYTLSFINIKYRLPGSPYHPYECVWMPPFDFNENSYFHSYFTSYFSKLHQPGVFTLVYPTVNGLY